MLASSDSAVVALRGGRDRGPWHLSSSVLARRPFHRDGLGRFPRFSGRMRRSDPSPVPTRFVCSSLGGIRLHPRSLPWPRCTGAGWRLVRTPGGQLAEEGEGPPGFLENPLSVDMVLRPRRDRTQAIAAPRRGLPLCVERRRLPAHVSSSGLHAHGPSIEYTRRSGGSPKPRKIDHRSLAKLYRGVGFLQG